MKDPEYKKNYNWKILKNNMQILFAQLLKKHMK